MFIHIFRETIICALLFIQTYPFSFQWQNNLNLTKFCKENEILSQMKESWKWTWSQISLLILIKILKKPPVVRCLSFDNRCCCKEKVILVQIKSSCNLWWGTIKALVVIRCDQPVYMWVFYTKLANKHSIRYNIPPENTDEYKQYWIPGANIYCQRYYLVRSCLVCNNWQEQWPWSAIYMYLHTSVVTIKHFPIQG